ncbi:MAG: hypothetical protein Q9225_005405 [Loekoesia sp. 1 TL-2023]
METDIAIVGMACRVAGANTPTELWENLLSSKDFQRRITRFNIDGFYKPGKGLTKVDHAYMLDDDAVDKFDNAFFHITPTEAIAMDPQHRMLLEVSYEATENAGIPLEQFAGTDTAVFTGIEGSDYHTVMARDPDITPKYIVTGTAGCMAANRLSYFYDLSGPSISVDTACSSSMAALHQAVRTLQRGDSNMAIVCGANLNFNPESFLSMSELGFLSANGRCCSFDASAGGYGRGEGIGALILKPLKKAVEDNDPVRAVIKGTRLNQDGKTQGITLPSTKAQQQNMDSLYREIAIDPSTIQYLEAHGTGTAAGDPLEMQAINAVYNNSPLIVGSVKSSIGHCEAASALMGLMKTVNCLENAQIPAQMHFKNPNPAIDFTNRTIATKTLGWPDINSRFIVASDYETLCTQLQSDDAKVLTSSSNPVKKTLFVFTGQGAQWAQMGCALIDQSPLFRSTLEDCDNILQGLPYGPSWSIVEELSKEKERSNVNEAEYSQPLCTALQIGIVCLLRSWGIKPDAVVGHSSGEICAAFAAGLITMRNAIITAYYRGHVLAKSSTLSSAAEAQGSMCAVGMGEDQCLGLLRGLEGRVQLAAVNSPYSCTLSGDRTVVQSVVNLYAEKGQFCRELKVGKAYHSHHMEPLASPYQRLLEEAGVEPSEDAQRYIMISSVTGTILQPDDLTPTYWARNMTSTVRFTSAIEECLHQRPELNSIVEVGPHPALKGPTQEILRNRKKHNVYYFSTCKRATDDLYSILESAGDMIAAGMPVDLCAVNAKEVLRDGTWKHEYGKVLTDLPSYQWNHTSSFWSESRDLDTLMIYLLEPAGATLWM